MDESEESDAPEESWKTEDLIPKNTIIEAFGIKPWLATIVMRGMAIPKLNKFFRTLLPVDSKQELFTKALKEMNISLDIDQKFYEQLPDGPFFTISNHAYGLLDGVILISEIGKKHPDFKVTANYLLSRIKAVNDFFVPVNPFDRLKKAHMGGTIAVMRLIEKGTPVGLFPAGEVATRYKGSREITDRPWMISVFRLIAIAQVPVIPVFFRGTNSPKFHRLGRLHPLLRTWRLIKEWHNKRNKTIRMETGDIIYPDEYNKYETPEEKREFFRQKVYDLK
ncbi:MAG: 1-acyl-sn-glycerol-3-phosphate acyltransferase [Candidatus Lokiarchaeota archaeon]|nr:1-acyl-sn-glycerol-3-phosphate acyltransferase [Candidatus Lokiarchaeota archaeon]